MLGYNRFRLKSEVRADNYLTANRFLGVGTAMAKLLMMAGGIGGVVWLLAAGLIIVGTFGYMSQKGSRETWLDVYLISKVITMLGAGLVAAGCFGLWREHKSSLPLVAFATGIVSLVFLTVETTLVSITRVTDIYNVFVLEEWLIVTTALSAVLLGSYLVIVGASFAVLEHRLGRGGSAAAAGAMAVVTGVVMCTVVLSIYGIPSILLIPTMILLSISFGMSQKPVSVVGAYQGSSQAPTETRAGVAPPRVTLTAPSPSPDSSTSMPALCKSCGTRFEPKDTYCASCGQPRR